MSAGGEPGSLVWVSASGHTERQCQDVQAVLRTSEAISNVEPRGISIQTYSGESSLKLAGLEFTGPLSRHWLYL
jgi:hypothetical protein